MTTFSSTIRMRGVLGVVAAIVVLALPPVAGAGAAPAWKQALEARSSALDEQYHLGRFAVPASAATTTAPDWLRALEARGRAMNRQYHVGAFAVPSSGGGFQWGDAAVGAGFAAAVLLLVAAAALAFSRRVHPRVTTSA